MELDICTKMLRNLSEKHGTKFCDHTLVFEGKNCRLDDAFSELCELETRPVDGQSLQQKDKKRRKRKGDKILEKKPKNLKT